MESKCVRQPYLNVADSLTDLQCLCVVELSDLGLVAQHAVVRAPLLHLSPQLLELCDLLLPLLKQALHLLLVQQARLAQRFPETPKADHQLH